MVAEPQTGADQWELLQAIHRVGVCHPEEPDVLTGMNGDIPENEIAKKQTHLMIRNSKDEPEIGL